MRDSKTTVVSKDIVMTTRLVAMAPRSGVRGVAVQLSVSPTISPRWSHSYYKVRNDNYYVLLLYWYIYYPPTYTVQDGSQLRGNYWPPLTN